MQRYEIRCTTEQTRKALELGATIDFSSNYYDGFDTIGYSEKYKDKIYAEIPTAEQMIGWLEEQGLSIEIFMSKREFSDGFIWCVRVSDENKNATILLNHNDNSRKEATLAAIDAALDVQRDWR